MKITNPNEDRPILAKIEGKWYEVPAGESIDLEDYVVASTLVEYGAKAVPAELAAARELWAERNRGANSLTASASASEGKILGRQQRTVDVATGTVDGTGELKGSALDAAVREANENGAEIKSSLSAGEKRTALAAWQAQRGASSPVTQTHEGEFEVDEDGNLRLDEDGQPIPVEPLIVGDNAGEVARAGTQVDGDDADDEGSSDDD